MSGNWLQFGNPAALWLLLLVPGAVVLLAWFARWRRSALAQLGDWEVLQEMMVTVSRPRQMLKSALRVMALTLLILAAARPQVGTRLATVRREGIDMFIAVDVSDSMLAEDIKPNRLERAKQELSALLDILQGDRVGLIAFAGTSFVLCPLTLDYSAARMFIDYLEPGIIPQPGTAIGHAIRTAVDAFSQHERKHKVLVLITDGEDHDTKPLEAAKAARAAGVRIYTIGIGSKHGEPIPVHDQYGRMVGFKKDDQGEVVLSKLDTVTLQKIALETSGKHHHATPRGLELQRLYDDVSKLDKKRLMTRKFTQHEDRFQWLAGLALLLLALEFSLTDRARRRPVEEVAA